MSGGRGARSRERDLVATSPWMLAGMAVLLVVACAPSDGDDEATARQRHELSGEIVSADPGRGTITVAHDEIPGFMPAMTMPFNVEDDWVFEAAEPGARIEAVVVVSGSASRLEEIVITRPPTAGAAADAVVEVAEPGEEVPDIPLVNQDGEELRMSDFRGGHLVFSFIYTRCPLPDFCPRMSANFAELHTVVRARPEPHGDARLLAITLDPDYDTPPVLRDYAGRYLDLDGPDPFGRWQLARAEPADLAELARFTGLRYHPSGSEVVHNLRTAIVDPEGRLLEVLAGNAWEPAEILEILRAAASGS